MKLLEGKTALVTGASRGIGKSIALALAKAGADIAFTYYATPDELAEDVKSELDSLGVKSKFYLSDAGSFDESERVVGEILQDFGKIDVLVNNAGITRDSLLMRMTEEQWDQVLTTNLKSVFNMTKQVIFGMMKQRSGSIINITSVVGVSGNAGQGNYAASKAGMIGFTKSIAAELGGRNIRCNAIAPGFIKTDMTDKLDEKYHEEFLKAIPMKRQGTAEEVASTVLFLASDLSSYVNGQTINVCGGMNR